MTGHVIVSLEGTQISEKERLLLKNPKVGGLVLFKENWQENAENPMALLKNLIHEIRQINPNILIMVDHEGGKVWRFEKGFTKLPAAKTFGETYNTDPEQARRDAFDAGKTMATELKDCGIDMSLAPVLDLEGVSKVIGGMQRAFHPNPQVVAEIAECFIRGMNAAGMPATGKHYPGHGRCLADSHLETPQDHRPIEELEEDIKPFQALINQGLLSAVMPAYVVYPAVDPKNTAGLSSIWLQERLRKELKFEGVIMSDCLSMEGANIGSALEKLKAAQDAGCDFLMLTHQHGSKLDNLLTALEQIPNPSEMTLERLSFLADSTKHYQTATNRK